MAKKSPLSFEIRKKFSPIVTIFGSSTCKPQSTLYSITEEITTILVENGYTIANGGYTGTMDVAAKIATQMGGVSIGITTAEIKKVKPSKYLTHIYEQKNLMLRLNILLEIADLFIFLPGSTGTLTEFALALDKQKLGLLPIIPNILVGATWHKVFSLLFEEKEPLVPRSTWKNDQQVINSTYQINKPEDLKQFLQKR